MARPKVKPTKPTTILKHKQSQLTKIAGKQAKNWVLDACDI